MSESSPRVQRIADLIQRELAMLLQLEVNDPRIGMVSITGVEVSRDLAHARVFVTVMNSGVRGGEADAALPEGALDQREIEENVKALNRAAGYLRSLLSKRLRLRTTPKLQFIYDASIVRGNRLSALIDDAVAADQELHG